MRLSLGDLRRIIREELLRENEDKDKVYPGTEHWKDNDGLAEFITMKKALASGKENFSSYWTIFKAKNNGREDRIQNKISGEENAEFREKLDQWWNSPTQVKIRDYNQRNRPGAKKPNDPSGKNGAQSGALRIPDESGGKLYNDHGGKLRVSDGGVRDDSGGRLRVYDDSEDRKKGGLRIQSPEEEREERRRGSLKMIPGVDYN